MSNKAGWYIAGHGVYMLHMLVSEWQGSRWCNYNMRGFYKCVNHRSVHTELKQHMLKVGNRLAAKYRFAFFIYTMRAKACCACRVSRLTMNLNYSARRTGWNTIRQQMLSDFCAVPLRAPIGEPAVLMSVLSLLSGARGANYSLRNPECVALGLGAAQPTQMFVGMKPCDCAVSALWPTECAFKEDSQTVGISPGTLVWWHHVAVYLLWSTQRFIVGYDIRYETLQLIRAALLCMKKK